jgi:mono/diheme cytochrome c family protein
MKRVGIVFVGLVIAVVAVIAWLGLREDAVSPSASAADSAALVVRGAYLAHAGDCMACHTARGGAQYAGGRAIRTPFGTLYAPNITPDKDTGIGSWSADDFWHALHDGKGKGGKLLYPAFPFPNYTKMTRADADALHAYFMTLTPVRQANRAPELRFPFSQRGLLVAWRALYFSPGTYTEDSKRDAQWNRGAYLVQGLGHCNACHTPRNMFGATQDSGDLRGAMIPMLDWYASPLTGEKGSGLGDWDAHDIAQLLKTGVSPRGAVSGPMAEVVQQSLQHLGDADIAAMTAYLKSLPAGEGEQSEPPKLTPETDKVLKLGAAIYEKHCVDCHKAGGEGEPPHYPPLAGNRAVLLASPVNPVRAVLHGGYPPSTNGNPRPFGMPPFGAVLSDAEAAAVVSYIRNAWGNHGSLVGSEIVNRYRAVTVE